MNEELFAFTVRVKNIGRAHVYAFPSGRSFAVRLKRPIKASVRRFNRTVSISYRIHTVKNVGFVLKIPTCPFFKLFFIVWLKKCIEPWSLTV